MPIIKDYIRATRQRELDCVTYYTGTVTYWMDGAVWVYQRSFRLPEPCKAWVAMRRRDLWISGPEMVQAAE